MKSLLLLALGLARTVVLGVRIEAERIVVAVRPHKKAQRRCPVCGRVTMPAAAPRPPGEGEEGEEGEEGQEGPEGRGGEERCRLS